MCEQTSIDPFRELNRYDDHDTDFRSSAVYDMPRRTASNGWRKYHADRDCGSRRVRYVESDASVYSSDKYDYDLFCWDCGYPIPESEVLFVGGDWYREHGWKHFGRPLEDLFLLPDRVLELGPTPDRDELVDALEVSRIEREASVPHMFSFGKSDAFDDCTECGSAVPVRFDERCRMCYDGEWTDRMDATIEALARSVRERNNSFRHRLPTQLSPTEPGASPMRGTILWRRHDAEGTTKLVEVTQRLEDADDGHMEYVLSDPTHTQRWQYHEDDLEDCFWDTGLSSDEVKPVMDDRIRAVWQRVCDHSFSEVHDSETLEVVGEQCMHCRKRRE